jgi:hypothetical protein
MAESAKDATATKKPLHPAKEVKEKMRPLSRRGFYDLLKRAINSPASKPHQKST